LAEDNRWRWTPTRRYRPRHQALQPATAEGYRMFEERQDEVTKVALRS